MRVLEVVLYNRRTPNISEALQCHRRSREVALQGLVSLKGLCLSRIII